MPAENRFASAVAMNSSLEQAIAEVAQAIGESLAGKIDLAFAFVAGYPAGQLDQHLDKLYAALEADVVLGTTCQAIICDQREYERQTGVTVWAAQLPQVEIIPMHLTFERSPDGGALVGWPASVDSDWPEDSCLIVFGEPFDFPVDGLLERFNEDRPGVRIIGGMASGAYAPGEARIFWNGETFKSGAVVVRLSGHFEVEPIVSQGCRPIGEPMVITAAERNIIQTLGGQPALVQLKKLFDTLPTRDQRLVQNGLHVGRVISEYQDKFAYGDFLIRNVVGIDDEHGWIGIGDYMRPGQTIQFHLRDQESASAELDQMLANRKMLNPGAALLFSCNGRGLNLFPNPDHDADLISARLNNIPLAGFFAAGEIGPVGGKNFLHGFTASVALFS
jgi:small ligand-binding sensory domain FIST